MADRMCFREGPLVVVDEDSVGAQIFQEILPVAVFHASVMRRDVAQGIGQYPIVIRRTAYASAVDGKYDAAAIPKQASMITDDTQPKRHVSRTGSAVKNKAECSIRFDLAGTWADPSGHIMPPS